jgi:O-antigen/teichoic acid export membrane protein
VRGIADEGAFGCVALRLVAVPDHDDRDAARRAARPYLTTFAVMLVVFGIGAIVLPLLPANSPEQADDRDDLWWSIPLGALLIVVGSVWTVRRVRRHGSSQVGHPPIGPGT